MADDVLEIAEIDVIRGEEAAFERAVAKAAPHFRESPGCLSLKLLRSIEHPSRYRLVVGWDSVDAHILAFRAWPGFHEWRRLAGPYFASPPRVEHVRAALEAF